MKHLVDSVKKPQPRRKKLAMIGLVGIAVIVGLVVWFTVSGRTVEAPSVESSQVEASSSVEEIPQAVKGKYLFSGTIVMARAVEKYANGDYSQPFSKFDSFKPNQYDGWTADWECPSDGDRVIPYAEQVANAIFNCRPEWLPEIAKYFNVLNLANNHTSDAGAATFKKTQNYLTKTGIQVVGNYDPSVKRDICEVIALPVQLAMPDGKTKKGTLPVAYCAWHYFERDPLPGEIEVAKDYAEIMPVFGLLHDGVEYAPKAGANQVAAAHKIIDNGAEFVIGNSPHWVQNTEVYKGKLIAYSTGNFIFDQLEAETNRGASIEVSMKTPYDDNVAQWLNLGESCKKQYDDCLSRAKSIGLQKINLELTYDVVANISGARQLTQKAPAHIQAAVERRMNWAQTKKELEQ